MPRASERDKQMRQRIALEAARIIVEDGVKDYYQAKRKAAEHLNAPDSGNLPRNSEVEAALVEYQRLFKSTSHPGHLRTLREAALQAMEFFEGFDPRLVGSVLRGTAGEHSDVNLHVFADTPEDVEFYLLNKGIPHESCEVRIKINGEPQRFSRYRFMAGDVPVDVVVFPASGSRQAPLSPVDGKPMQRATRKSVLAMLDDGEADALVTGT